MIDMGFLEFVWPEAPVAQGVIGFLVLLFCAWAALLVTSWSRLRSWMSDVERAHDVAGLKSLSPHTQDKLADPDAHFTRVSWAWNLSGGSPVRSHILALYRAGLEESRLDVSELIAHTSGTALADFGFLRVGLGSFIVVGLLGTLLGLAESLSLLGPALEAGLGQEAVRGGLSELLGGLQSAFGPSIVGVLFTVVGVIAFGVYVWRPVTSFRTGLERATLTNWVPTLYPTTAQRLTAVLERSEEQMHRNFEAAERVAEFAKRSEGNLDAFSKELDGASVSLHALRQTTAHSEQAASELGRAAERFTEASGRVSRLQEDVGAQLAKLEARTQRFEESVSGVFKGLSEGQDHQRRFFEEKLQPVLALQSNQVRDMLEALRGYEAAYLNEREDVGGALRALLVDVRAAYEAIGRRNEEFIERVGHPLQAELSEGLGAIRSQLQDSLNGVQQVLGRIGVPLETTAEQMGRVAQTMDDRMQGLLREVQQVGSSRVDLQACKLEYSIVSPK